MGFVKFRIDDLKNANLQSLIDEIQEAVNNGRYTEIGKFAKDFATEIGKATLFVNDEGKRQVEVNGERADLANAVEEIVSTIGQTAGHTLTGAQITERTNMLKEVDAQLTALFKQDQMMQELIARGFDPAEFKRSNEEANNKSDDVIRRLNDEINDTKKEKKEVLGEDFKDPLNPSLTTKSLATKLQDHKDAKTYLENTLANIKECEKLEKAIRDMENEIAADPNPPTKENQFRGNIDANKGKVAQLTTDIQGAVASMNDLQLATTDITPLTNIHNPSLITRNQAKIAIGKLINGDTTKTPPEASIQDKINGVYTEIADKIVATGSKAKVDPATKAVIDKIKSGGTPTPAELTAAQQATDDYINGLEKRIERAKKGKAQEEILKVARTKSIGKYQELFDRQAELNAKHHEETRDVYDADGNVIGTETILVANATDAERLADFDETGRRTALQTAYDTDENNIRANNSSNRAQKRATLEANNIGNRLTRFLFPGVLMRRYVDKQVGLLQSVDHRLQSEKNTHLAGKSMSEAMEQNDLRDVNDEIQGIEGAYKTLSTRAPIHSKMQDGAYDSDIMNNTTAGVIKQATLVKAMEESGMEELALRYARAILTGTDLEVFNEVRNTYDYTAVTERNTSPTSSAPTPKNAKTPEHEDR